MAVAKTLIISSLIASVQQKFSKIPDPKNFQTDKVIPISDHLMSGLAIFSLKFPSLLQYDQNRYHPSIQKNLQNLYRVKKPPSDSYLRERLDQLDPSYLRPTFKKIFATLQRSKYLEQFEFFQGHYLLSIDATSHFSSSKVSCDHCCQRKHASGKITYYHQMLCACVVHPDKSQVIPLCPEMIGAADGNKKNDCESNASKRLIANFRREHPHLKAIVIQDGLYCNAPHVQTLENHRMKYILGAKPGDQPYLFDQIENSETVEYYEVQDEKGSLHQFRFLNGVSLNKTNKNLKVNFIDYRETRSNGKEQNFSWITNIPVNENNVHQLMRGGRARWKIENETFNTLKNLGYNLEHNYGHGQKHLMAVLCTLMVLAFLIDQIQGLACPFYQLTKSSTGSYRALWEHFRVLFQYVTIETWEKYYETITKRKHLDSS